MPAGALFKPLRPLPFRDLSKQRPISRIELQWRNGDMAIQDRLCVGIGMTGLLWLAAVEGIPKKTAPSAAPATVPL